MRTRGVACAVAMLLWALPARAEAPPRDCVLGFLAWCVLSGEAQAQARPTRFRFEVFGGYKFATSYYLAEQRACEASGCSLRFDGPLPSFDAFARLWGNPLSDDYFDLGLSYSSVPVVALRDNPRGLPGELGPIAPGDGDLAYATVRVTLRRPSFLWLIKSKYLISAFGVGLAFPVAQGAGRTFTGADGPKLSLGGRLGLQWPLSDTLAVGVATAYGVVWYGTRFDHAAFTGGYGLNLQWLW